ncbi:MAG: AAA family ATPase [Nitrosopumilaceae archaeon]
MITSVELGDFLSHSSTKLDFGEGVTVFVGDNGSGKSSIIDAITFALFGQHTRKSNKGLIRRGASQGFAKVNFTINGKFYQAERKIDTKGTLSATFIQKIDDEEITLASGERKQFGESMTKEVEARIGLDFDRLKIASIVQQGELNSIINAKPKEFKELLNAIIGIDKLDVASELMKTVQKNFRNSIQEQLGYDDTHFEILKNELEKIQTDVIDAKPLKQKLVEQKSDHEKEIRILEKKIEKDAPKIDKLEQLETRKSELIRYAKDAIRSIQEKIDENQRKIRDCEGCFEIASSKGDTQDKLTKTESELDNFTKKIHKNSLQLVKLKEQKSLASKLKLKDKKCPVCDSEVDHLNPLFQVKHLKEEEIALQKENELLEMKKNEFNYKRNDYSKKLQSALQAEATLRAHSIHNIKQIESIKQEISTKKNNIQKIPSLDSGNLIEVASIDSHAKILYEEITKLEKETKGFVPDEFNRLKISIESKRGELTDLERRFGAIDEKINQGEYQIKKINSLLNELKIVKKYVSQLCEIQEKIFNRDGPIATSLRSWALNAISTKASEYLMALNTKIHRIALSEKTRDVSITCYSRNTVLDIESLSGGEQVSVALALRLGMAHLLGVSNLNFMILDEPTTHLDQERRKFLVDVFSQLSNITHINSKPPLQFIIITHDSEIFEDSNVERIYRFESSPEGTKVTVL